MQRKYYHINAQGKVLGRLATEIAKVLSGRNKVDYTPNVDGGDFVVVTNSDGVIVTGNKRKGKKYYHHTGFPGGIKEITFEDQIKKDSTRVIYSAVKGMLPKNKLQAEMVKRLLVVKDDNHNYKIDQEL
jgi:large subunit ribosomal protein L13